MGNAVGDAGSIDATRDARNIANRAARSLRELADYLDRHPEALLHGRG